MSDPKPHDCPYCDSPGGEKTYQHQVAMWINGRVRAIDYCIYQIIAAFNVAGISTAASCCGHKTIPATIILDDGRWVTITDGKPDWVSEIDPPWWTKPPVPPVVNDDDSQESSAYSHQP